MQLVAFRHGSLPYSTPLPFRGLPLPLPLPLPIPLALPLALTLTHSPTLRG